MMGEWWGGGKGAAEELEGKRERKRRGGKRGHRVVREGKREERKREERRGEGDIQARRQ